VKPFSRRHFFHSRSKQTQRRLAKAESCSDSDTTIDAPEDRIAQQEKSIVRCLIEGDSNKCIARKIDITEATMKVHIKAILRKIRFRTGRRRRFGRSTTDFRCGGSN
jgi:two-component system nitrate/nitrite response regulator NarL